MKYMLLVYGDSSTWGTQSDEEAKAELEAFAAFERDAGEAGVLVARDALRPEGYTFTNRNGAPEVTEGIPSDRRIGCIYVLSGSDVTEVAEWASRIPLVGVGGFDTIEIRPVME
jgi:hypothetical protein